MAVFSYNPFSENYWRSLFRRVTWQRAAVSLRRLLKDTRAIRYLAGLTLQAALVPLIVAGVAGLLALTFLVDGLDGSGPAFALVGLLIGLGVRSVRAAGRRERILARLPQPLPEDRLRAAHAFFCDLAIIYAIFSDRAASEAFLKQKVLPEHLQVISRQKHMELIRKRQLWEKLLLEERRVLMMPDGEWNWPLLHEAGLMQEHLRLTRWILRKDFFLADLGLDPKFQARLYKELLEKPDMLADEPKLIRFQAVAVARRAAHEMHSRCMAEEIHRGYREDATEQAREWARGVCERLGGKQSEDFLVGDTIVSDLAEDDLLFMTEVSGRRKLFLEWTERILKGEEGATRIPAEPPPLPETAPGLEPPPYAGTPAS